MQIQIEVAFHPIAIGFDFIPQLGGTMACSCDLTRIHEKKEVIHISVAILQFRGVRFVCITQIIQHGR
jgi:hypothetical protein